MLKFFNSLLKGLKRISQYEERSIGQELTKNVRLERLLDKNLGYLKTKGFKVKRPEIWLAAREKKFNRQTYRQTNVLAEASVDNFIVVYPRLFRHDDMCVEIIIAHELGHIIDFQTGRIGHPLFDNIRHLDAEMFAHAIAAYLHSKLAVAVIYRQLQIFPYDELSLSQLMLKH